MSDLRVDGYEQISFWQEDGVGVIVLRSANGVATDQLFDELALALSQASIDDHVRSLALTGFNLKFLREVRFDGSSIESFLSYLERLRTFASIFYSIRKNVYSIVNGDAINIGFEIALLSDMIISSDLARLGFSDDYQYRLLGSSTGSRFNFPAESKAAVGRNCDFVLNSSTLLEDAKKLILKDSINRYLPRRVKFFDFEKVILMERELLIDHYKYLISNQKNDSSDHDSNK